MTSSLSDNLFKHPRDAFHRHSGDPWATFIFHANRNPPNKSPSFSCCLYSQKYKSQYYFRCIVLVPIFGIIYLTSIFFGFYFLVFEIDKQVFCSYSVPVTGYAIPSSEGVYLFSALFIVYLFRRGNDAAVKSRLDSGRNFGLWRAVPNFEASGSRVYLK